jgi:transposase-like protein
MPRVLKAKRRVHSEAFKKKALARMKTCDSVVGLAKELEINWRLLYHWRDKAERKARAAEEGEVEQRIAAMEKEIQQLKISLGEKVQEADFFESALQKVEALRQNAGGRASTTRSGK